MAACLRTLFVAIPLVMFAFEAIAADSESGSSCSMTYMWPNFIPINFNVPPTATQIGNSEGLGRQSPLAPGVSRTTWTGKPSAPSAAALPYRLLLYREGYHPPDPTLALQSLQGVPVIYIPGSGGSYLQARSLASVSHHLFHTHSPSTLSHSHRHPHPHPLSHWGPFNTRECLRERGRRLRDPRRRRKGSGENSSCSSSGGSSGRDSSTDTSESEQRGNVATEVEQPTPAAGVAAEAADVGLRRLRERNKGEKEENEEGMYDGVGESEGEKGGGEGERERELDWFSVDLNEELTAMDSASVERQARFVVLAVKEVASLYDCRSHEPTLPTQSTAVGRARGTCRCQPVILVGHSMGGLVARLAAEMLAKVKEREKEGEGQAGAQAGSEEEREGGGGCAVVNTVLTLASPHILPPVAFQPSMLSLYSRLNSHTHTHPHTHPHTCNMEAPDSLVLASIASGPNDMQIRSWSSLTSSLPFHSSFPSLSLPHVWLSTDHLGAVWCNQLAAQVSQALLSLVDPSTSQLHSSPRTRASILQAAMQHSSPLSAFLSSSLSSPLSSNVMPPLSPCLGSLSSSPCVCTPSHVPSYDDDSQISRQKPLLLALNASSSSSSSHTFKWLVGHPSPIHLQLHLPLTSPSSNSPRLNPKPALLFLMLTSFQPCSELRVRVRRRERGRGKNPVNGDDGLSGGAQPSRGDSNFGDGRGMKRGMMDSQKTNQGEEGEGREEIEGGVGYERVGEGEREGEWIDMTAQLVPLPPITAPSSSIYGQPISAARQQVVGVVPQPPPLSLLLLPLPPPLTLSSLITEQEGGEHAVEVSLDSEGGKLKANHFATISVAPMTDDPRVISLLHFLVTFWRPIPLLSPPGGSNHPQTPPPSPPPFHPSHSHHITPTSPLLRFSLPPLLASFTLHITVTPALAADDKSKGTAASTAIFHPSVAILQSSCPQAHPASISRTFLHSTSLLLDSLPPYLYPTYLSSSPSSCCSFFPASSAHGHGQQQSLKATSALILTLLVDPTCPAAAHLSIAWLPTLLSLFLSLHQLLAAALLSLAALSLSRALSSSLPPPSPPSLPLVTSESIWVSRGSAHGDECECSEVDGGRGRGCRQASSSSSRWKGDGGVREWSGGEVRRRVGVRGVYLQDRGEGEAASTWGRGGDGSAWNCTEKAREALKRAVSMMKGRHRVDREKGRDGRGEGHGDASSPRLKPKPLVASVPAVVLCGVLLFVLLSILQPSPLACHSGADNGAVSDSSADSSSSISSPSLVSLRHRLSSLIASISCITTTAVIAATAAVTAASLILLVLQTILPLLLLSLPSAIVASLSSSPLRSARLPLNATQTHPPSSPRPLRSSGVRGSTMTKNETRTWFLLSLLLALLLFSLTFLSPAIPLLIVAIQLFLRAISTEGTRNSSLTPTSLPHQTAAGPADATATSGRDSPDNSKVAAAAAAGDVGGSGRSATMAVSAADGWLLLLSALMHGPALVAKHRACMWLHPIPLIDALPVIALLLPHLFIPLTAPLSTSFLARRTSRNNKASASAADWFTFTPSPVHSHYLSLYPSLHPSLTSSLYLLSSVAALAFGLRLLPARSLQCIAVASLLRVLPAAAASFIPHSPAVTAAATVPIPD